MPAPGPRPSAPPLLGREGSLVTPVAPPPTSVLAPAAVPIPELFRPPLVPPPAEPVAVVAAPKVEPPAPVMLPARIVAPLPARPHVAPPRLFSAGENVPLPEIHPPEPVVPAGTASSSSASPLPLVLDRAATVLEIEGPLTLARIAERLAALPGLGACVLEVRHETAEAGAFPADLEAAAVRALAAPLATAITGREGEHITIFAEHGSASVFTRGVARLAILHRARVFLPGVREKIVATAEALAEA